MIPELRKRFNQAFTAEKYLKLRTLLDQRSGATVEFRIAETPAFVQRTLLEEMAQEGAALARSLITNPDYLSSARRAIPAPYCVANQTSHPNFLTADFALVRNAGGELAPKLVEIQAFPSVFGFQA